MLPCVILCGGASKRMGIKKETLEFGGTNLATFQAKKFKNFFKKIYFSSKNPIENLLEIPTILDSTKDIFAPIFGLKSILETLQKDVFVLSVDAPFLTIESVKNLILSYEKSKVPTFFKNDKIHPLLGVYTYKSLQIIEEQIKIQDYKLLKLLDLIKANFVAIPTQQTRNLNTPQDYKEALNG
ncbi:NTP transferase domain-containing protein [Helicobacter burdigaliensis]|uniref:NTP transferase domain-containing protein n=1 Tax=Helicobacter burdigaliensis TaxID=2315334 RepID=UPI000EF7359D|nr:NTP transferase domain-containing protein [Helicobacter burdigaliensis]